MDSSLGRKSYTNQKKLIDKTGNTKILIPGKHLRLKMKGTSSVVQHLNHPFTDVYVPIYDSIKISTSRIFDITNIGLESQNLNIKIKYGLEDIAFFNN